MSDPADLRPLLAEIRDLQREHLAEYRRVTQASLALQERAVLRQEQMARTYRVVLVVGGVVVAVLLACVFYLLSLYF